MAANEWVIDLIEPLQFDRFDRRAIHVFGFGSMDTEIIMICIAIYGLILHVQQKL